MKGTLKAMQEWLSTPVGAAMTGLGIISFTSFSLISNYLETDNKYLGSIIILWPYVRESLKSLRNALRGVSSTLTSVAQSYQRNTASQLLR